MIKEIQGFLLVILLVGIGFARESAGSETANLILISEINGGQIECRVPIPWLNQEVNEEMFRPDGEITIVCISPMKGKKNDNNTRSDDQRNGL